MSSEATDLEGCVEGYLNEWAVGVIWFENGGAEISWAAWDESVCVVRSDDADVVDGNVMGRLCGWSGYLVVSVLQF